MSPDSRTRRASRGEHDALEHHLEPVAGEGRPVLGAPARRRGAGAAARRVRRWRSDAPASTRSRSSSSIAARASASSAALRPPPPDAAAAARRGRSVDRPTPSAPGAISTRTSPLGDWYANATGSAPPSATRAGTGDLAHQPHDLLRRSAGPGSADGRHRWSPGRRDLPTASRRRVGALFVHHLIRRSSRATAVSVEGTDRAGHATC